MFNVMRHADGRMRELHVYLDANQAREEFERLSARSD
jgi:hypothetical protein